MRTLRFPIRLTILTLFVGLAVTIVIVISLSNFVHSSNAARDTAMTSIYKAQEATAGNVEEFLQQGKLLVRAISALPAYLANDPSGDGLFTYFRGIATEVPWVYSMFVGYEDGRFVQTINLKKSAGGLWVVPGIPENTAIALRQMDPIVNEDPRAQEWRFIGENYWEIPANDAATHSQYDPRVRPWYERAIATGQTGASDIYVFSSLQKAGVTISAPMLSVPGGVVGFDAPLDVLADFVKEQKPSENGLLAIIAEDGTMIAHPDPSKIITRNREGSGFQTVNVAAIADPLLKSAFNALENSESTFTSFTFAQEEYFAQRRTIVGLPGSRWRLLAVAKVDDFTGPVRDGIRKSAIYSLIILIVAVIIAIVIASWIARPLIQSSIFAEQISKLDFTSDDPKASPLVEIQRLTGAMAAMRSALTMFLKYAPSDLVHQLVISGKTAEIGGEQRDVTLLFTDIEGFTGMSEKQSPEEVLMHTSVYFEALTEAIIERKGTIDKFMGDAIMAMWNAPADDPQHVDNACMGALAARAESERLNKELVASNFPLMRTRFGLHTGEALVGNMGSPSRMQFTSLGPVVNLASRIEGVNKFYGTQILVTDAVCRKAASSFLFRRVDIIEAKGTSVPVTIYELMGERGENAEFYVGKETLQRSSKYEQAFDFYLHREFDDALYMLNQLSTSDPDDPVSKLLAEKCRGFLSNPPPQNWNGATRLDTK